MNIAELEKFEQSVSKATYSIIKDQMVSLSSGELLHLLDSKSNKVGDTAAMFLWRKSCDLLVDALLERKLRTAAGRLRATNILNWNGRACKRAIEAYLFCLDDRSFYVFCNGLFGIVFLRRTDLLEFLQNRHDSCDRIEWREQYALAIASMKAGDPYLYSPNFHDAAGVWNL